MNEFMQAAMIMIQFQKLALVVQSLNVQINDYQEISKDENIEIQEAECKINNFDKSATLKSKMKLRLLKSLEFVENGSSTDTLSPQQNNERKSTENNDFDITSDYAKESEGK